MSREPLIDALRVVALAPVFVVNLCSFSTASAGPLTRPVPPDDPVAQVVAFVIAALFQAKGYPLLAFVFGYSFALARTSRRRGDDDGTATHEHRRRRLRRLLGIGIVHGLLIYWGDVLTLYAASGLLLLACSRWRLRRLCRLLRWLGVVAVVVILVPVVIGGMPPAATEPPPIDAVHAVARNAGTYLLSILGSVFVLPQTLALMLAGFMAGRLRLLTHRRWRSRLARIAAWALPVGLLANVAWAAVVHVPGLSLEPLGIDPRPLVDLFGPLLLVGLVARWALRREAGHARVLAALAPAGPHALSIYLGSSLIGAVFLGGAGLGLRPPTALLFVGALAAWALLVVTARAASLRGARWPLERWLARA